MNDLYNGVRTFHRTKAIEKGLLYDELTLGQSPHTLFITCSDSRVVPHHLTSSQAGELFVLRNVANTVPPFERAYEESSAASAVEYAVKALTVRHIVVCGHSNCGGCKALFSADTVADFPLTNDWLVQLYPLKEMFASEGERREIDGNQQSYSDNSVEIDIARRVEQQNILLQLERLRGYPFVEEAIENDGLELHGWYFDIGEKRVLYYDESTDVFRAIE